MRNRNTRPWGGCSPLSEHERGLGLGVVVAGRRAADEHGGATVAAQRVLQDPRHFAVAIRNVRFLQDDEEEDEVKKKLL